MNCHKSLRDACAGALVRLQFRGNLASETVVSDMLQSFNVRGNILHGKVEYIKETPLGIFIMELNGEETEVNHAIDYLKNRIQQVEVIK